MEHASYSILFTGNFLRPLPHEAQWTHLRKLFPYATEAELLEFFKGKRLLVTHTDSELTARELVSLLGDRGLECEYARNPTHASESGEGAAQALPQPHVRLASHFTPGKPAAPSPAAEAPRPVRHAEAHVAPEVIDEDALTPRGRRWATIAAIAAGSLSVYAIWSTTHSTYGHAESIDNGEMIPSLCAMHESTSWFSGHGTYSLACSASNESGRYKLLVSCTKPEDLQAQLAFYDAAGRPRVPGWPKGTDGLPLQYRLADGSGSELKLLATDKTHVGTIEGLPAAEAGALLASASASFSGVFGSESVTFQFEPARWYVNALIFSCQLEQQGAH